MAKRGREQQAWWCEQCHASGLIEPRLKWVSDVMRAIKDGHEEHALALTYGCTFDIERVRVQLVDTED